MSADDVIGYSHGCLVVWLVGLGKESNMEGHVGTELLISGHLEMNRKGP